MSSNAVPRAAARRIEWRSQAVRIITYANRASTAGRDGVDFGQFGAPQAKRSPRNQKFADSPPEGNGFERPVPREIGSGFETSSELEPIYGASVIRAVAGLGIPIDSSSGGPRSRHSPDQVASHHGSAIGGASASRNRRFESAFLQRGVRCELDLGEGDFAYEIAAAPPFRPYFCLIGHCSRRALSRFALSGE
jgi:hypothetical protein